MAFQSLISHRVQFSDQKLIRVSTKSPADCRSSRRKVSDSAGHDMSKKFDETRHGKLKFRGKGKNLSAIAFRRRQRVTVQLSRHLRPGWMKSAVSSLLRKTREVFVGTKCNAGQAGGRAEFTDMEPYFSMPVLPAPTSIVMHV